MKFKYSARTKNGELQVGYVEAVSKEAATEILSGHELFVLSIEGEISGGFFGSFLKFFNRIKLMDLMVFTRQFATLLDSDVPLGGALLNLEKQTKNPVLKEVIYDVSNDVSAGLALSQALERQNHVFSDFYLNMIKSAEITGRLAEVMKYLAEYLDKEVSWKNKIRNAMIYPAFLIALFLIIGIILLTVVFPKLLPFFQESGVKLPLITQIFLNTGNFLLEWWWMIIIVLFFFSLIIFDYFKTEEGKNVLNDLMINIPIFGNLFRKIYIARFTESLSVLIKGGVPITQAIEIASHNIGNIVYKNVLHNIAEGVRGGELFSNLLFQNEGYFPYLVGQMVAIGESTGKLEQILSKISEFYSRETDDLLNNLTELIQPVLIVSIGVFVGLIFAAILVPIYSMMQNIQF